MSGDPIEDAMEIWRQLPREEREQVAMDFATKNSPDMVARNLALAMEKCRADGMSDAEIKAQLDELLIDLGIDRSLGLS